MESSWRLETGSEKLRTLDENAAGIPSLYGIKHDGQVRSGQVRSGQVRSGQVRSGQVRSGLHANGGPVLGRRRKMRE